MSSFGINRKEVVNGKEYLEDEGVRTPTILFSENNIKPCSSRKLIIKKRHDINISDDNSSDLGKRKLVESFGVQIYNDKERYGQDIPADFFETNIGHNVYEDSSIDEAEILEWCYKYLASKKK